MKLPKSPLLLLVLLLPGFSGPAATAAELTNASATEAGVEPNVYYRWIDPQGRVQYTDFEPIGVPSQQVELNLAEEVEGPMLERAGVSQPDAFHDQDDQILPIEHIGPCADARRQLTVLHSELPVYRSEQGDYRMAWRGDEYRGERRYLEAEERMAAIQVARNAILSACSDPDAFRDEEAAFRERTSQ